ncbi:MAG: rhomboid family intramembrane serine protease [Anaerolineales bacterium]
MTDSVPAPVPDEPPTGGAPPIPPTRPSFFDRLASNPSTAAIILITVIVFIGQTITQQLYGFDLLLAVGAKSNADIMHGQIWRLLTPIFLHVGLLHIGVNMYSLYIIGPAVERPFGSARFTAIYFLSGVGGVASSLAFSQQRSAGASGAIFGLLGALAGFLYIHRSVFGQAASGQLRQIVFVALLNLAIGLSPGIDNWGHIGGLLVGIALAFLLGPRYQPMWTTPESGRLVDRLPWSQVWIRAVLATAVVLALAFFAALSPFTR